MLSDLGQVRRRTTVTSVIPASFQWRFVNMADDFFGSSQFCGLGQWRVADSLPITCAGGQVVGNSLQSPLQKQHKLRSCYAYISFPFEQVFPRAMDHRVLMLATLSWIICVLFPLFFVRALGISVLLSNALSKSFGVELKSFGVWTVGDDGSYYLFFGTWTYTFGFSK